MTPSSEPVNAAEHTSEGSAPARAKAPAVSSARRVWEWFSQSAAIEDASSIAAALTSEQRILVEQSRAIFDLGERVRDRITTVTAESSESTAIILFHQAGLLALAAAAGPGQTAAALWLVQRGQIVPVVGLGAAGEARLDQVFPGDFPLQPSVSGHQLKADADILQRAVGVLVAQVEEPHRQADVARGLRFFRMTLLVLSLLGLLWGGSLQVKKWTTPRDLLDGKPWQASSTYPGFTPGGSGTAIFFHTQREKSPWIQFDLGTVTRVRRIEVRNRTDVAGARAVPLVIELSRDAKSWTEVARKQEDFTVWETDFSPTEARFLRARAEANTWLHLEWLRAR